MVWQVIGDILPLAAGAAIAVMPVIAVVVMLTSPGGRTKAIAMVGGWLVGAIGITAVLALLGNGADVSDERGDPSVFGSMLQLLFGLTLLVLAIRQAREMYRGVDEEPPGWLARIDRLSPAATFAAGAVFSIGNLKNIVLVPSAAVTISRGDLRTGEVLLASLVFGIVATSGLATPLVIALAGGDRADAILTAMRSWLTRYSPVVLAVTFLILGWDMLGKGIGGLFS